ncbi:MAG TPA: PAS domain-containing sensor histidine kinase [Anaeromyxobacteraceae bacterium]|nr:PAS domain-containing sensor histidine kinase [Anaeromyxobacteraceae bacterium]
MPSPARPTFFLPAGRSDAASLRASAARLAASQTVAAVFQAADGAVAILDGQRQIVAVNAGALALLGEGAGDALGLRPGEALGCTRAADGPDGCGTGAACASCGAALAILSAEHRGRPAERECTITVRRGDRRVDVDLRVRAAPLDLEGERFVLIAVADVSAERRRQMLERSFSGDVIQALATLRSAAAALGDPSPSPEAIARVRQLILQLDRAVQIQRALAAGVGGQLEPVARTVSIAEELAALGRAAESAPPARGRRVEISSAPAGEMMVTDPAMLQHVLLAMVLNALEASRAGGTVRVHAELGAALVTFSVWNAGHVPAALVHRIFQRYFTTRGPGRGNGTWSMKVVGEELLRGEVGFRTSEQGGTTFWLTLPRRPFAHA